MAIFNLTLRELQQRIQTRKISVSEVVCESYKHIANTDHQIGSFLTLNEEIAHQQALKLDNSPGKEREMAPLFGVPAGIKDNILTKGIRTTCASKFLDNFTPIYDATVMSKLYAAGVIPLGKLNMDEFAMGGSNENSAYHVVRNPWDRNCVPGGSSGGSAAAVAAGQVFFSLGSDTGGSIRQPASYCGVVGLKPTYGLVSRFGLVAFASSLDQIGPLTKNVEDAAYVLQAIAGHDPQDSTSARRELPHYASGLTGEIKGMRIGVPKEYFGEGLDPQVQEHVFKSLQKLESLGACWEEISLPHTSYAIAVYQILASSEASSNLARFDGIRFGERVEAENLEDVYRLSRSKGFGAEVKRRILLGTYALSSGYFDAYYRKAQQVRSLIKQDFVQVFQEFDLIISPTTPTTAFKFGKEVDDPLSMYLNDVYSVPASLAGLPAISISCGFTNGLPVGLQMIGKPFEESTILRVAHALEQELGIYRLRPELS